LIVDFHVSAPNVQVLQIKMPEKLVGEQIASDGKLRAYWTNLFLLEVELRV
jgi:hypothetical protein